MKKIIIILVSFIPVVVYAQTFGSLVENFLVLINSTLIPLILALSVFVLLFGIFKYTSAGADEKKLKESLNFVFYGIISISIALSVFGLIYFIRNSIFPEGENSSSFTVSPKLFPK